ncbi:NAD(P)-binding domain-containing protein [Arthrobacter sp. NPDC093128]|uniref:NAD(P)-binding domain-containing protein n=1 Tax=Arthrobacter sp. NPDC093128 TaxID=3154979 RepID=UPI00342E9325
MSTIGFIGSGAIGSALARLSAQAGYDVIISNSRGPATLADLVADLGPRARAATPAEAARKGDLIVVAVQFKHLTSCPPKRSSAKQSSTRRIITPS